MVKVSRMRERAAGRLLFAALVLCSTASACRLLAQVPASDLPSDPAALSALPQSGLPREQLLVGAVINGLEVGALDVIRLGVGFLVPLETFAELSGCAVRSEGEAFRFETPIGDAELRPEDLLRVDGVVYLRQEAIEDKLAGRVAFDTTEFALRFDLPWRPDAAAPGDVFLEPAAIARVPDVTPPDLSLSTVELDIYHNRGEERERSNSSVVLNGRLLDGWWRMRYQNDLSGNQSLREYAWLRTQGQRLYLVGQQQVSLHPLLGGLQLTGVQVATTNQPIELFSRSTEARELLPRRVRPLSNIRGVGPPAGSAELRLDGSVIARQTIGLDGVYEFLDVALPSRQVSQIEVLVYDRYNPSVPVAIHQQTQSASDFLLPRGALIHMGGLGREGNLVRDLLDSTESGGLAGFYQWRYGLSDRLTVEAAVQQSADSRQVMAGLVSQFSRNVSLSLGAGGSEDGFGYDLMLEALRPSWRFLARSRLTEAGFLSPEAEETFSHFGEIGYRGASRLDLSLIGRSVKNPSGREEFVLPAISWRPWDPLYLRARPDVEGDYRYDLSYRFGASGRFAVTVEERASATLSFRPARRYRLSLGADFDDDAADRYSAILRRFGSGQRRTSWIAGALYAGDEAGFLAGVNLALMPGILARIEAESDPQVLGPDGKPDRRVLFGLTADLAFSRGRFMPARALAVRDDRGAIAGRVRIDAPVGFPDYSLEKLEVLLEGLPASQTQAGGSYFVGDLEAGLYRVELDRENLPIELTPERVSFVVEVAPAAVTRLDFVVKPEFGLAGQVTDAAGNSVPGIRVEILDADGQVLDSAVSDRFGRYRIDGLAIGSYTLRVAPRDFTGAHSELPSRRVEIVDDYLFDQDLRLPSAFEEPSNRQPSSRQLPGRLP